MLFRNSITSENNQTTLPRYDFVRDLEETRKNMVPAEPRKLSSKELKSELQKILMKQQQNNFGK